MTSGNPHPSWRACEAASWRAWEASSSPGEQLGNQMSWKDWQSTLQAASCQENCPGGRVVGLANLSPVSFPPTFKKKKKEEVDCSSSEYVYIYAIYMCVYMYFLYTYICITCSLIQRFLPCPSIPSVPRT